MNTLRVLLVSTSYPIREGSVSGIFVKNLVTSLAELAQVTVITPGDDQNIPVSEVGPEKLVVCNYVPRSFQTLAHRPGGIPARLRNNRLSVLAVPFLIISMLLNIVVRARNYDVVHCNWAITGFIVSLLRRFIRKPIVTTLRGEDVKTNAGRLSHLLLKKCLKDSDKVVLVSAEMHHELVRQFPHYKSKFLTIYNGVDSIFLKREVAAVAGNYKKQVLRIITVASLIPRKNVGFILAALALCQDRGLEFEYIVIGEGEELSELKSFAKGASISKKVKFLGRLGPDLVAQELSKSPIFLTSSKHEGRPNVVIEAMAAGACVLASDIAGHRELIKDTGAGLIFDLVNAENLADVICKLAADPVKVAEFGKTARKVIVSEGLTWGSCAGNYRALFESLKKAREKV